MVVVLGGRHLDAEGEAGLAEPEGHHRGGQPQGVVHRRVEEVERLEVALVLVGRRGGVGGAEEDAVRAQGGVEPLLEPGQLETRLLRRGRRAGHEAPDSGH